MRTSFEDKYPAITRWVREFGRIEIGYEHQTDTFIRALEESGMPWGGKSEYRGIDQALGDLERGIGAFLTEHRSGTQSTARSHAERRANGSRKRVRNTGTKRGLKGGFSEKPPGKDARKKPPASETPAVRKVRKLGEVAEAVRQREHPSVTRLTVVKGLCGDPQDAGAFALFLARKVQGRMREKDAPKRYRELVNRAVRELKPYLDDPSEERRDRLRTLNREIEAEQNEHERIGWTTVRNIKSFDLLVVEHAVRAVLSPHEAPFWLYYATRDYTGRTDVLPPSSAQVVEEIVGFWRKHLKVKG